MSWDDERSARSLYRSVRKWGGTTYAVCGRCIGVFRGEVGRRTQCAVVV